MSEITDIPRCHYCGRLAPEIHYEFISVCPKCLSEMNGTWYMYRLPDGEIIVSTETPDKMADWWEHLETGSFEDLWAKAPSLGNTS